MAKRTRLLPRNRLSRSRESEEGSGPTPDKEMKRPPMSWWQWVLMYPAFIIALIGAVPQYIEILKSWSYGVPVSQVGQAEEQLALWKENFECTKTVEPHIVTTETNTKLTVTGCPSGDLLVEVRPADSSVEPIIKWISYKEGLKVVSSFLSGDSAYASDGFESILLARKKGYVICQRWLDEKTVLRRVRSGDGCYDETVNVYTGRIIKRIRTSCDSSCG